MLAFPCLDAWLTRAMARKEAIALGPEDKAARQRARVRQSKRKAKLRAQLSTLDAPTMTADGVLRDILRLDAIKPNPFLGTKWTF
jgi:hypothetical protein